MIQIKLIIGLVIFVFISTVIGGAYLYYRHSEETIANLNQQNATLSQAVDDQKQTIEAIQESLKEQSKIRNEMMTEIESARKDVENLQEKVMKHNLTMIASQKSELLQKKINNATEDVLRCFEVVTGAAINPNEKNNQCSDLFITP